MTIGRLARLGSIRIREARGVDEKKKKSNKQKPVLYWSLFENNIDYLIMRIKE